jgi:hypothetical protein
MPSRYDPKYWRDRAEEMRRLASNANDEDAKQTMLRIADDYDELASRSAKTEPAPGSQRSAMEIPPAIAE